MNPKHQFNCLVSPFKRIAMSIIKEIEKQKLRRQKTEHLVAKYAKENPDMVAERSKEILARIDNSGLKKPKLRHIEYRKMPTVDISSFNGKDKRLQENMIGGSFGGSVPYSPEYSATRSIQGQTSVKSTLPGPGAAISIRNIVNYGDDDRSKSKSSRLSKRKGSDDQDSTNGGKATQGKL